ncbi:hypothetical protein M3Y96_00136800 [Aphelenchoides besseyi]|nr:hypothetical protein M3Y96_00136800 [Aphelenchoides besseyi]
MIVIQTREAFERFANPASKPAPRFESFSLESIPRPGFVICFENQVASIMRGYGSTDFRMLLSEYAKDEPNLDRFNSAQMEFEMLERLLNGTPDETQINEIRNELKNFREISMLLDFSTFDADSNVLLTLRGYRIFRRQQFGFDDCWHEHRQKENNREHFVECRMAKVRKRFEEFKFHNLNFFEYFYNVSMKFEDMAWNISLANTNYAHETYWHPEYGPCESIKPIQWEYSEDDLEDDMKDVLFIWTNYFEALQGASSALFLSDPKQNALLNKIELYAGDYLEIELAGYEEFENELCSNRYPRVCSKFQRPTTNYSYAVCRWCDAWIRTCTCAVPQVYHPDITLRNCTFFESVNCTHRYKVASLKKSSCDPECKRQRFTIHTRQQPLELELLPEVFERRVQEEFQRLTHSLNDFFEYPYDSTMKMQLNTGINRFNTADELYPFLEAYFRLFQLIYRIGYGNNYTLPVVFAENNVDSPSLASFIDLNQSPLNTCGIPGMNVIIERFLSEYLRYFKGSSFQQFFNCTRSIPLTSCAQILGNQTVEIPALLDLMESRNQMFERSSFELMVTTNGSINPAAFIRKYYIEDNMDELVRILEILQSTAQVLNFALNQNFTFSNNSEFLTQIEDARSNVQKLLLIYE